MATDNEFSRMVRVLRGNVETAANLADARRLAPYPERIFSRPIDAWNGWKDGKKDHFGGVGSQNHALHAAASTGWWQWIVDFCRFELDNGIRGREQGSPEYYHGGPIAAVMVALELAGRAGKDDAQRDIRCWLRALWALDALCATHPGRQIKEYFYRPINQRPADLEPKLRTMRQDYDGPLVVMPGMRWRQDELGHPSSRDWLFAWAMNMNRSYPRLRTIQRPNTNAFYPQVFAELADVSGFHRATPAAMWGLTDGERDVLRRVVGGDLEAAREALTYLEDRIPIYLRFEAGDPVLPRSQRLRIRRFADGSVENYCLRSINGNKPGVQAAQYRAGDHERLVAAAVDGATRDGQNNGWGVRIDESSRIVRLSGTNFQRYNGPRPGVDIDLPMLTGEVLWDLEVTAEGVVVHELGGSPPMEPDPPMTDPPSATWEADIDAAIAAIGRAQPGLRTQPALGNIGAILDRVRFLERGQSHPDGTASRGARTLVRILERLEE